VEVATLCWALWKFRNRVCFERKKKVDQISGGDNLLFFEILGMTSNEGDKQDLLHGADILQAMWC
jgi:hypothetical protein